MRTSESISLVGLVLAGLFWHAVGLARDEAGARILRQIGSDADRAINAGDLPVAVALLEKGLRIDPNWKDGLWKAGLVLYQGDQFGPARRYLSRLTQVDGTRGLGWALLGMCDYQLGEFRAAIEHIDRADRLGMPKESGLRDIAYLNRGLAHIELGNFGTAIELLRKLAPREDAEQRERLVLALGYASLHLFPTQALSAEQSAQVRAVGEAHYLSDSGNRQAAAAVFAELFRKYPKAPLLHYAYGTLLLSWAEDDAAKREFRAELANTPDSFLARLGLAYVALEGGGTPESLRYAKEAAEMRSDSYQARLYYGRLLLRNDRPAEACPELEAARRLSPSSSSARFALAKAYRMLGREAEAAQEFKEFERLKALEEPAKAERTRPR